MIVSRHPRSLVHLQNAADRRDELEQRGYERAFLGIDSSCCTTGGHDRRSRSRITIESRDQSHDKEARFLFKFGRLC